ncbi:MAG TPA: transglutaminase domain-containing protein [Vicinamibacteria bacterium]|nr:transglutaminase domain-containing protein [Vicinamibacteria bacterium]
MRWALETLWVLVVVLVPALGVWLASSLALYRNGPVWLALGCGLLLFPVLPVAWEVRARRRRAQAGRLPSRTFTTWDRVVLRTLAVNVAFMAALLAGFPGAAFAALSTRGDWFLQGRQDAGAQKARRTLFAIAGGLEWLHGAARPNPYDDALERRGQEPPPSPQPAPVAMASATPAPPVAGEEPPAEEEVARFSPEGVPQWPLPPRLHPAVAELPASAETGIAEVARYLAARESDPWLRVKALHDYVADRVAYDVASYRSGRFPPQDAQTVFRTRLSVCAGYANLLAALGEAAGETIVVVGGDARGDEAGLTGEGHAWNAARIGGRWALLDATWDAGSVDGDRFAKEYGTEYLFPPPEVQGVTHFPEEPEWQLRTPPLSRGEFFRQPMMKAGFFAEGLALLAPDRSQVTVQGPLEVSVANPRRRWLLARYQGPEGQGQCAVSPGDPVSVRCAPPAPGSYRVRLFVGRQRYGQYEGVGQIEAHIQ